jgi:hypothetical protein
MDAQLKAKWIEALRSGEFEQCHGRLTRNGAFCCLGVLAKIAGHPLDNESSYDRLCVAISADVHERQRHKGRLVRMNDDERATFPKIAEYIETNIPTTPVAQGDGKAE